MIIKPVKCSLILLHSQLCFNAGLLGTFLLIAVLMLGCVPINEPTNDFKKSNKALELIDLGTANLRQNNLDLAEGAFLAAIDLTPSAAAIDGLGCVAFMRDEYENAEKYFIAAYEVDKSYYSSIGNLALLYEKTGQELKAEKLFRLSLSLQPDNFRTRNNYAVQQMHKQNKANAKMELFKALALAKHPIIATNLRRIEDYE